MIRFERRILIDSLIIGGLLTLVIVAADLGGLLTNLENWLYDLRVRKCQRFSPPPTDKLVHIDIDDRALAVIGAWPWPRTRLAEILDEIRLARPKTVALDILFSEAQETRYEPDASGVLQPGAPDANLAAAMKRLDNVILAGAPALLPARIQLPPIPAMTRSAAAVGFVDYLVLRDGIVRSVPLVVESDARLYPQMGLAMACQMLGTRVEDLRLSEDRLIL